MSSDFYFRKWKKTLFNLQELVNLDIHYQTTKAHDKKRCEASNRLSGMLGEYMTIYKEALECLHQNLQVQKTRYLEEVVKAVVSRILELKHELRKLDACDHQFLGSGLAHHKLTTHDAELTEIPCKKRRPEHVQVMIDEIMERARKMKNTIHIDDEVIDEQPIAVKEHAWWDDEEKGEDLKVEVEEEISEEGLERKRMVTLIQAHEKSRQVVSWLRQRSLRREKWEKDLKGTLKPQARYEIRERSARLIQKVLRAYFELKRQKHRECKRDELLGLDKPSRANREKAEEIKASRSRLTNKYLDEMQTLSEQAKMFYMKRNMDEICENYRDFIRDWFRQWFDEIQYFHDIPEENQGGAALIFKEELPSPLDWLEDYKAYVRQKIANKNKTPLELKFEKMQEKREAMLLKKEELMKKKLEQELMKKIMKNPSLHPGFNYPESKKTEHILEVLEHYRHDWSDLDSLDTLDVKEESVKDIILSNSYMEAKLEIAAMVEEDMRNELKELRTALRKDYKANDEKMPEPMKKPKKGGKRKHAVKATLSKHEADRIEDLVLRGIIKDYPKTKLEDFIGDPNFAGNDIRCNYRHALPLNGETRGIWWERCCEVIHGFHRIVLVGPHGSGKTTLIHAIASVNDAVLFQLDPAEFPRDILSAGYLQQLVLSVASCAKAAQPSVIHIKDVQRLYYIKVPPKEADMNLDFIKSFIIRKLFKRIHKTDKITIIGSCVDPWVTKSKQILKQFPNVVLLPNTSYSTVVQLLKDWVISNNVIPSDLDVSSLAYVLRGYSFGYLKQALQNFLSPQRIIQIAARGLSPGELYNYILEDEAGVKTEYAKYEKWYTAKTQSGKKEKKHLEEQIEFKKTMDRWAEKMAKDNKSGRGSTSSMISDL